MNTIKLVKSQKLQLELCSGNDAVKRNLIEYIEEKHPTGDFLHAVLSNDLLMACGRNDGMTNVCDLIKWIYNNAPAPCWGSAEKIDKWLNEGK